MGEFESEVQMGQRGNISMPRPHWDFTQRFLCARKILMIENSTNNFFELHSMLLVHGCFCRRWIHFFSECAGHNKTFGF